MNSNHLMAEERNGSKMRMDGLVNPWSCTSSGAGLPALVACARRSLFFKMRRRFLKIGVNIWPAISKQDALVYMVKDV
jgi:hypothetical protein